ncbi:MAG: hypothetical protein K2W82_11240 [Candidatus Obscuribacterales bacterium]|nr:hypothetical protein [Candidatus Obscuribacterales bacterium]
MSNFIRTAIFLTAVFLCGNLATAGPPAYDSVAEETIDAKAAATAAATRTAANAEKLYHDAWLVIQNNYVHRAQLKDWHTWEHKFDGKLKNETEAVEAINKMLGSLNEAYTYYKAPSVVKYDNTRHARTNVVSSKMLSGNIGYIKITTFSSYNTADEVEAALKSLSGADAYVIDLRDNYGGFVDQAFQIFSLFVDQGKFTVLKGHYSGTAYVEERNVRKNDLETIVNGSTSTATRRANLAGKKPVTILVNANSASASEMLSGAFKDNNRATIVGTITYGKGIAQVTFNLTNGGAVQVTYASYYFPSGTSIHQKGLTPHKTVQASGKSDVQLDTALELLANDLPKK